MRVMGLPEFGDDLEELDPRLEILLELQTAISGGIAALLENKRLIDEADYWKKKYQESLNDSIKHGDAMMGNLLTVLIQKG